MNLRSLNSSRRFIPITLVGPPSQYSHLRPVRFATPEDNRKSHKHHPYEPTTSDFYDYTAEELSFDLSRRSSKSSSLSISAHSAIDLKRLSVAVALGAVHVWPADRKLNRAFQM